MLDVPYEVKKALRKGNKRKNYKIKVYDTVESSGYNTLDILSDGQPFYISESGTYNFWNSNDEAGFKIYRTNGSSTTLVVTYQRKYGTHETDADVYLDEITTDEYYYYIEFTELEQSEASYLELRQLYTESEQEYIFTIDNDTLVSESVKIDERMVTGKELKFGLCEGSSIEFQYFDHPNINGKDIQVFCSIEYINGNGDVAWYDIPMGWYIVDQCPRQWSTGIYKVTAYNKLKSDYLDTKANGLLHEMYDGTNVPISLYELRKTLLNGFAISTEDETEAIPADFGRAVIGSAYSRTFSKKTFSTGGTSPLNIGNWGGTPSSSSSFTFNYWSDVTMYYLEENKNYTISFDKDVDLYEEKLYDYINNAVSLSGISSPKTAMNTMIKNGSVLDLYNLNNLYPTGVKGWGNVFSVVLVKSDNSFEVYSKIGYKNSIANCKGSIKDLTQNFIYGFVRLFVVSIRMFENASSWSTPPSYTWQMYENDEYTYYRTSSATRTSFYRSFPNFSGIDSIEDTVAKIENITKADRIKLTIDDLPDVTLRDLTSAGYEIDCQYGQLDRETDLFTGVELNQGGLYPADNLYPSDTLYPDGNMEHPFPSNYSKLWTDTVGEQSFRYLIITYKGTENGQEVEKKIQRTVNADGTTDYNMSDNWLFKNLVWSDADVGDYADAMVLKMQDIRWFPFEMWAAGLPYIETGDAIEITDKEGNSYVSYVLQRQLNGIHNLQDTYINGELDIF